MSSQDGIAGTPHKAAPVERRDEAALSTILAMEPQLYVDIVGAPTILLPLEGPIEQRAPHRLHSRRTQAALYAAIRRKAYFVPFHQEVRRILWILEDMAWRNVRTDVPYGAAIEQHDLLDAVHILLHDPEWENGYDGTCSLLLEKLNAIALETRIDMRQPHWPKGAARLSQQLWELRRTLRSGGIEVTRGRTNGPRWIRLHRVELPGDAPQAASEPRQGVNSLPQQTLLQSDDSDGALAALLRAIEAPQHQENL